jgi:hypothetical protein
MAITCISVNRANVLSSDLSKVYPQAQANAVVRISGDKPLTLCEQESPVPFKFYDYYDIQDFVLTEEGHLHLSAHVSFLEEQKRFTFQAHFSDRETGEYIGAVDFPVIESTKIGDVHQYIHPEELNFRKISVTMECRVEHNDGTETRMLASRQSCAYADIKLNPHYEHIYPKKEESTVIFGQYDSDDQTPSIYTHDPNYIVISLYRRPQSSGDSDYVCNYGHDANNQAILAIPGSGTLRLGRSVIINGIINPAYAYLENIGGGVAAVTYSNIQFKYPQPGELQTGEVQYDLVTNWNQGIQQLGDLKPYYYNFKILFTVEYHVPAGNKQLLNFCVSSSIGEEVCTGAVINHRILPLKIMWGCLAKGTLILTTQSEIPVEDIRIGDRLIAADGQIVTVRNVWTGEEADMVKVSYEDQTILLTAHHPVYVISDGKTAVKRAGALTKPDTLAGRNKNYRITEIEIVPYNDTVYNLSLDGGNAFFANGILVGDMDTQNDSNI